MKGKVKFFNDGKGFGFIAGEDGKEYFVHSTGIAEGTRLNENDAVTFVVVEGDRGLKAEKVALDSGAADDSDDSSDDADDSEDFDDDSDDKEE